jgi:hypothetical protein
MKKLGRVNKVILCCIAEIKEISAWRINGSHTINRLPGLQKNS